MKQDSSGLLGFFGLIVGIMVLITAKRYAPSVANILFVIIGVCIVFILLLVAVVIYFALRKPKLNETQKAAVEYSTILKNGRQYQIKLRNISMEIKNTQIRSLGSEVCISIEQIFRVLKEKPEKTISLRHFFNYYLPTLEKILVKYKKLEANGVPTEDVTQSTITCLNDIKEAMLKLYNSLFEDDILDLTVEMEVLKQICKRDGLLTDEDFNIK